MKQTIRDSRITEAMWRGLELGDAPIANKETGLLFVTFNDGSVYMYGNLFNGVPFNIFHEMCDADSVGKVLDAKVKGFFPYTRIQERRK